MITASVPKPNKEKKGKEIKEVKQDEKEQWYFADEEDKASGIETIEYPNGGKSKRATLSGGKVAVMRRLKGFESVNAGKIAGEESKVYPAMIAVATKFDGVEILMEDVLNFWTNDYIKLQLMNQKLNF